MIAELGLDRRVCVVWVGYSRVGQCEGRLLEWTDHRPSRHPAEIAAGPSLVLAVSGRYLVELGTSS